MALKCLIQYMMGEGSVTLLNLGSAHTVVICQQIRIGLVSCMFIQKIMRRCKAPLSLFTFLKLSTFLVVLPE